MFLVVLQSIILSVSRWDQSAVIVTLWQFLWMLVPSMGFHLLDGIEPFLTNVASQSPVLTSS
jgi:hypothetical protein